MDTSFYLDRFQKAAAKIDKKLLDQKQVETAVVLYGKDCVVLKLYKRAWTNQQQDPLTAESRIFFSVWVSDASMKDQKLLYNIHALQLRQLKGYAIQSRKFADRFRQGFKPFEHQWHNVRVDHGPQTLMEGWLQLDTENLETNILTLAYHFLEIEHLVDDTLLHFK